MGFLSKDLLNEAHAEDMRQQTARAVAQLQPDPTPPPTPAVDFEGLTKHLLSSWTDPSEQGGAPSPTPSESSQPGTSTSSPIASPGQTQTASTPPTSTSLFDLPAHAKSLLAMWETPKPQDTSGVEPGSPSAAYGPVASSAPEGSSPLPSGAQPAAMPTGGKIDNSSREAFIKTAYPHALQAADGDPVLARQLLATAISENGKVGTGRDLGEMGFNVGGIQGVEGTAGSFTANDAGRPRQFAAYNNLSEGFRAVRDLVSGGRYAQAAANYQKTHDIDRYWKEVNEAGYSETPDWQDRIGSIRRTQVEPITAGLSSAPSVPSSVPPAGPQTAPAAMAQGRASSAGPSSYTQQGLADAGDPDAWAKCGPVAAYQFALRTGRQPNPSEVEKLAKDAGWTPSAGMAGFQSETKLLASMGIAARAEQGVDWDKVITDVSRGNPVILQLPGHEGHYVTAQGYDPKTGKIDFGSTVGDLRAAGHKTQFTPTELEGLGWGTPTAALYLDNPATPAPSAVAGPSPAPVAQAQGGPPWSSSENTAPSSPTAPQSDLASSTPANGASSAPAPLMLRQSLNQPTSGADTFSADQFPSFQDSQTEPASPPLTPSAPLGPSARSTGATASAYAPSPPTDAAPSAGVASAPAPGGETTGAGAFQDDYTNNGQTPPLPKPGTLIPIQNPDGSVSTELSITVTEPGLNGGRPTNIPTVWGGRRVSDQEAVDNAIRAGVSFPSFPSIKLAVQAARQRTQDLGAGRAAPIGGAAVPDEVVNPGQRNRAVPGGPITEQQDDVSYRQPLGMATAGADTFSNDDQIPASQTIPDESGSPRAPAEPQSPLKPVYDLLGNIQGYVHTGLQAAAPSLDAGIQTAAGAVQGAYNATKDGQVGSAVLNQVDTMRAETDHQIQRQREIWDQAAAWEAQNGTPDRTGGLKSVTDPAWRAANPDLAAEYDEINDAQFQAVGQSSAPMEVAREAVPALQAARPAIARGIEAVRSGVGELRAGAARAAARGTGDAAPAYGVFGVAPPEAGPAYSPTAPPGHTRMYHGTASDFPSVNPEQLDPKSLYGRGYYLTSDPRVAGGIVDETGNVVSAGYAQQRGRIARATSEEVQGHFNDIAAQTRKTGAPGAEDLAQAYEEIASEIPAGKTFDEDQVARLSAGALWRTPNSVSPVDDVLWGPAREARGALFENKGDNVRPVDVPNNLRLINADAPMTPETANRVRQVIRQIESTRPDIAEHFQDTLSNLRDYLKRSGKTVADTPLNDWVIKDLMTDAERAGYVSDGKYGGNDLATAILEQAGFDGIAHKGGQRVPMMDGTGQPIEHDVNVIFPGSVGRVRNALAGTYGGATLGTPPDFPGAARATDRLGAVNRVLSQGVTSAVSGGVGAATAQQLGDPNDPNRALKGFAVGAIAPYAISRGAGALARRAGRAVPEAEGALASLGHVPEEMHPLRGQGQLPMEGMPSDPMQQGMSGVAPITGAPRLPEAVARAQALAERQSQAAARAGRPAPPSVWDWIKAAGYAGIYSPATAVSSAVGGATELVLAQPKEAIRALVQGRPGAYGAQVRAQIGALGESLPGVWNVLTGNAAGSAAASGGSRGTAGLSERVSTPVGHFAARTLEKPGEILTETPDAVFRPLFRAQGAAREAQQAASDIGLRGKPAATYAERLMQDAEAVKGGQLPAMPETQRVIDAGEKYADQLGYKGKPGGFGQWLGKQSKRDDPIGVAASFLMPFPSMAARMSEAAVKVTPGSALLPGVRKMYPSKFDMIYDQTLGAVAASGVAYWAMNGGITGSGPTDKGERDGMIAQGWQPNSTLVAGHYIPNRMFSRFQPMLDTAGELHDALAYGKKDRAAPEIATDLAKRASKIVTDQTGLSGLADLHDMLANGFASQFPGFAARSLTRYVPYGGVLRAAAASLDPASRRADKWSADNPLLPAIGEQLKTAVPGLRQTVPAAQDVLGRPAENPQQGLGAFIPRTTTARTDPTIKLFQDAGVDIGAPRDKITVGRVAGVEIKPAEQRRWNELRGQFIQDNADSYTSNADFMALPPTQKQKYLTTFLGKAADYADKMLQSEMDSEDLTNRATDAAMKKAS